LIAIVNPMKPAKMGAFKEPPCDKGAKYSGRFFASDAVNNIYAKIATITIALLMDLRFLTTLC
jgi:hypothetical protein